MAGLEATGDLLLVQASGGTTPAVTLTVATIAAVTALIGATVAAVTAGRRQRRELAHDRELADVTELRSVLDAAGVTIERAARSMGDEADPLHEISDRRRDELTLAHELLAECAQRIRIRLGPSEAQKAYDEARAAHLAFVDDTISEPDSAQDESETCSAAARADFGRAREAFLVAAHAAVGVRVRSPRDAGS